MTHTLRTACRACGDERLHRFLVLGPTPLANAFLDAPDDAADEASYPLDVYLCEGCSLVQLLDVIDPQVLFGNYIYVTGTSETMAVHNAAYAATIVELQGLGADDLVVEVASNDGSLLRCFQTHGVRTLGVEPATNIAAMATEAGVETVNRFFDAATGEALRAERGPARAVIANNVLAHVDDTPGFLRGCHALLADDGVLSIEVPYLGELLEGMEYDTVYHEHLCYFSLGAMARLYASVGLSIVRVDRVAVHGGSLRVYARRAETADGHAEDVLAWIERERAAGFEDLAHYQRFARDVEAHREALVGLLTRLRDEGHSLAAYGAPAKGNTMLNYCGIDRELVPYTVDKNPLKVGKLTPGAHLPVEPASCLVERRPDYVLILAWNFADEIIRQQQAYRDAGGRFIIPLPQPRVV